MNCSPASLLQRGRRGAALLLPLVFLAACGPPNGVDVKYEGYTLQPSRTTAHPGPVIFRINNQNGQVQHEFLVVQSDLPADQLALGSGSQVDEAGLNIVARNDKIELGQTGLLNARLAPGHYILLCNIVGHYQLGMHADFTVAP